MIKMKKAIVSLSTKAREGHIPSAFSILDILWVLYDQVMTYDHKDPEYFQRDRFLLSKGHAALGLYVILAEKGFFPVSDLDGFATFDSAFGGHPDLNKIPGVEASTGSLGHGMPMAVGVALGLSIQKNPARVFTLIGDGESNEGSVWEAVMLAAHHNLSNLCCIVDYNHSTDRALKMNDLEDKFRSFGWETCNIDGHDHDQIFQALKTRSKDRPIVIVAETVKGKGCKRMENNPEWHHKFPVENELAEIMEELSRN